MDITKYAGNSRFLKAMDIGDHQPQVTIKGVYEETMQDGATKAILEFVGKDKQLVLNPTNVKKLIELFGIKEQGWAGQQIVLYAVDTGQYGMGIRIKAAKVTQATAMASFMAPLENQIKDQAAQAADEFNDEIPW